MTGLLRGRSPVVALIALIALAVLVALTVVPGYAAGLTLVGKARPFAVTSARCTNGPLTVFPSGTVTGGKYTSVTVTGISGSLCTTGRVIVYGSSSPGTIVFNGTGTVSGATMTSTSTAFTPPSSSGASAYVTLNGWVVPATWSFAAPLPLISCSSPSDPTATCTAVLFGTPDKWGGPPNTDYNAYFDISSSAATTSVRWQVTINLADATFPFVARSMNANNQSQLASGWTCSQLPTLTLTGQDGPNTALVGGGKTVRIYLNGHSTAAAGGSMFVCP